MDNHTPLNIDYLHFISKYPFVSFTPTLHIHLCPFYCWVIYVHISWFLQNSKQRILYPISTQNRMEEVLEGTKEEELHFFSIPNPLVLILRCFWFLQQQVGSYQEPQLNLIIHKYEFNYTFVDLYFDLSSHLLKRLLGS